MRGPADVRIGRDPVSPVRVFLLIFAIGMIPFSLGPWNGARLLGTVAVVAFIALTVAGAPTKTPNHTNGRSEQ